MKNNNKKNNAAFNPRLRAIEILQTVIHDKKSLQECFTPDDTPFVYQLTYGVLRFYYALTSMSNHALKQPLSTKDFDIYLLIILGIYQLQHLDIAEYAIVKETVDVADILKKSWAKKLINAILRRFLREREVFEKQCALSEQAQYSHPQWFINKLKVAWPDQWQNVLNANNEKAPMHLRVNRLKISRDEYLLELEKAGIDVEFLDDEKSPLNPLLERGEQLSGILKTKLSSSKAPLSELPPHSWGRAGEGGEPLTTPDSITLLNPIDVYKLPGFTEGLVSVQDIASQRVVEYLDLQPKQRVLDACAAPGGKTCHILEREANISELVALDVSAERLKKITENLNRLKLHATLLCGDAATPSDWWDKKPFDRILLDAPCSATGVIRRHPDIKLLRSEKDIQHAVQKQKQILEALWPLVKSDGNGLLSYTTCSVLPEENENQIHHFIEKHADAKLLFMEQILPNELNDSDGFFYAVLQKN